MPVAKTAKLRSAAADLWQACLYVRIYLQTHMQKVPVASHLKTAFSLLPYKGKGKKGSLLL